MDPKRGKNVGRSYYRVDVYSNTAWVGVNPKIQIFDRFPDAFSYAENCKKDPSYESHLILRVECVGEGQK